FDRARPGGRGHAFSVRWKIRTCPMKFWQQRHSPGPDVLNSQHFKADEGERHALHERCLVGDRPDVRVVSGRRCAIRRRRRRGRTLRRVAAVSAAAARARDRAGAERGAKAHPGRATVWALDKSGYAIAKKGGNAFTCVVSRRAGDLFPVCGDAEGTRSLLPLDFEDARLRLSGKPGSEIEAIEMERFKSGQYHAPSRAGVAYMLSPMRYRIDEHGGVTRTASNPHLMFYGPNLTDTDIGGALGW